MEAISANLATVRGRIEAAARAAGQPVEGVTLVAVSKTHPADSVRAALAAGQRVFGENRVQEAIAKFPGLRRDYPDLKLHLIGPLQTNKVKDAVAHFDVIETVDRPRLAEALAREMERTGRRLPCYVEVNTGEEPQKAGVLPEAADGFVADCRERLGLAIAGLMCIPPEHEEPALHFAGRQIHPLVGIEAELFGGVDRVEPGILQLVGAQLVDEPDAAPFLREIEQRPAAGLRDCGDRPTQLIAAIAAQARQQIAGK